MIIGEFSKTKVVMMYLDNLAEKDNVDFLEGLYVLLNMIKLMIVLIYKN